MYKFLNKQFTLKQVYCRMKITRKQGESPWLKRSRTAGMLFFSGIAVFSSALRSLILER